MAYVEIALLLAGVVTLVVGYRKNNRNLLLIAAIVLLIAGTADDFVRGLVEGLNGK